MNLLVNNIHTIYNLVYIAVILLGGASLTLTIILNAKENSKLHRSILLFISAIFLYMVIDFTTFYFLGELSSGSLVFVLITLSDTTFCIMVVTWVYAIMVFAKIEEAFNIRLLLLLSIIYLTGSQILSIYLGRYDSYTIHVSDGIWKVILQIFNFGYDILIIAIGLRCMVLLFRKYKNSASRNINLLMTILLIGYMLWIAYWDYSTWYHTESNLLDIYAMDPLILLYAILNLFLIYHFYKNDPLKLSKDLLSAEETIGMIARQYMLSRREEEVLVLVYRGMSNKQIAAELSIAESTVKRHIGNIFKKTGTQGRQEIIYKISNSH